MSNPNFHELVDDVFLSIEDSIEDSDIDIDYEKLLEEVKKMIKEIEDNFLKKKEN